LKQSVLAAVICVDMKVLKRSEGKFGIEGSPRGDNLYIWVSVAFTIIILCTERCMHFL